MRHTIDLHQPCVCGRSTPPPQGRALPWGLCCAPYVVEGQWAPDAEGLMRSRYSAFVTGHVPYLLATWHPSTRPSDLVVDEGVKWLGLEVRRHRPTGVDTAEVEFVARSRHGGRAVRLHEISRFVREAGRWWYVDGDIR